MANKVAPVTSKKPHPLAWKIALKRADGDQRRLEVQEDGSVLVQNHPH